MITSYLERKINAEYLRLLKIHAQAEVVTDDLKSNMLLNNEVARIITRDNLAIDVCFPDDYKKTIREEAVENVLNEMYGVHEAKGNAVLKELKDLCDWVNEESVKNLARRNDHIGEPDPGWFHYYDGKNTILNDLRFYLDTRIEGLKNESEQNG